MGAFRIIYKFAELLDVAWGAITDGSLLKRSGANITAAVAGTDYLAPTGSGAGLTGLNPSALGTGTGVVTIASTGKIILTPSGTNPVQFGVGSGTGTDAPAFERGDVFINGTTGLTLKRGDGAVGASLGASIIHGSTSLVGYNGSSYFFKAIDGGVFEFGGVAVPTISSADMLSNKIGLSVTQQASAPTPASNSAVFYSLDVAGTAEMQVKNEAGDINQLSGTIIASKSVRLKGYTVATLPAGTQGDTCFVSDALAPTFLAVLVGGGAVVTTALYNGTNWVAQ